ncbi:MAG: hypothetical protein K0R55_2572 [Sporomusa sp.]|jgi:hypothetical protein|nr:hypothetical protein [Sporomusa sp.]
MGLCLNHIEYDNYLGPIYANSTKEADFSKCIDCPGLCLNCIKKIYGIDTGNIKDTSYRVVYVLNGEIRLSFPYTNTEKRLDKNGLMLISNKTKFIIKGGNESLASCAVKNLNVVITKRAGKSMVKCSCG